MTDTVELQQLRQSLQRKRRDARPWPGSEAAAEAATLALKRQGPSVPPGTRPARPGPVRVTRPAAEVRAATEKALSSGGELVTPQYAKWDLAKRCVSPVNVEEVGVGHYQYAQKVGGPEWQPGRVLSKMVPCRKCTACLKDRAYLWGNRAKREYLQAPRTWFGTLTFNPGERYKALLETERRLSAGAVDFTKLPGPERFKELNRTLSPLVTKWQKRLRWPRKGILPAHPGSKLIRKPREGLLYRYLLTVEPHEDWTPHYHLLIHEVSIDNPIRNAHLEDDWPHGLVHWRLVKDEKAAFYAAKYLGKYSVARVHASESYGETINESSNDLNHRSF